MRHIYQSGRYIGRFTTFVLRSMLPAYRLARGRREKASVARLALKFVVKRAVVVLTRLAYNTILQDDVAVSVQGMTYFVGIDAAEISVFGEIYEDRDYDRVPAFIARAGWTVFDIGANAGVFTVQQAYRGARVYAFEPNLDCYRRLSKTVAANRLGSQVRAFNIALGASPGEGTLVVPQGWTSNGMIVPGSAGPAGGHASTVTIDTLDRIAPTLAVSRIDLLKIDTEGAELDVLRGGGQTLSMVERIVLEYHSFANLADARSLLSEHDFTEVSRVEMDAGAGTGILYAQRMSGATQ